MLFAFLTLHGVQYQSRLGECHSLSFAFFRSSVSLFHMSSGHPIFIIFHSSSVISVFPIYKPEHLLEWQCRLVIAEQEIESGISEIQSQSHEGSRGAWATMIVEFCILTWTSQDVDWINWSLFL